jgi:hypothetical protein
MFGHFLEEFTAPIRDEDAFPNEYSLLFSQITPRSDISPRGWSAILSREFQRVLGGFFPSRPLPLLRQNRQDFRKNSFTWSITATKPILLVDIV